MVCGPTPHALAILPMPNFLDLISKILVSTSGVRLEGLPSFLSGLFRFQFSRPEITRSLIKSRSY